MTEEDHPQCFLSFIITGICGFNIKKGNLFFASHPYVKLKLLPGSDGKKHPHHKQNFRTKRVENTTNPTWKEQFYIQVLRGDVLEFQVKSEQEAFSQFLGKIQVPVTTILERLKDCEHRYTSALSKRNYMDTTSGSLSFVIADGRSSLFKTIHESMERSHSGHQHSGSAAPSSGRWRHEPTSSNNINGNCTHHVSANHDHVAVPTTTDSSSTSGDDEVEDESENCKPQQADDDGSRVEDEEEISFERDVMNGVMMLNTDTTSSFVTSQPQPPRATDVGVGENPQVSEAAAATPSGQQAETSPPQQQATATTSGGNNNDDMLRLLRYLATTTPSGSGDGNNHLEKVEILLPRRDKCCNLGFEVIGGTDCKNRILQKNLYVSRIHGNSEAQECGMRIFDEIIQVDKCDVSKHVTSQFVDTLLTSPEITNFLQPTTSSSSVTSSPPPSSSAARDSHGDSSVSIKVLRRVAIDMQHQLVLKPKRKSLGKIRRTSSCPNIHLQRSYTRIPPDHHRTCSNELVQINRSNSAHRVEHPVGGANENITTTRKLLRSFNNSRKAVSRVYSCEHPSAEEPSQKDLPPGWEACQDRFGRIYYLDHTNRVTQWEKPGTASSSSSSSSRHNSTATMPHNSGRIIATMTTNNNRVRTKQRYHSVKDDRNYQRVMKRYQSIRRVIRPNLIEERNNGGSASNGGDGQQNTSRPPSDSSSPANSPPIARRTEADHQPAVEENKQQVATNSGHDVTTVDDDDDVCPLTIVKPPSPTDEAANEEDDQVPPLGGAIVLSVDDADGPGHGNPPSSQPQTRQATRRTGAAETTGQSRQQQSPRTTTRQQTDQQQRQLVRGRQQQPTTSSGRLATDHRLDYLYNPAFKFLTHADFNKYLHDNYDAFILFNTNTGVRYMIKKINKDKNAFVEYQHNKELVKFVNYFVDTSKQLPHGWERKTSAATGKRPFFVNHNDRFTTFFDPRLPTTPANPVQQQQQRHHQPAAATAVVTRETRAPVQSPLATQPPPPSASPASPLPSSGQPPEVAPRPNSTLTPRSRIIEHAATDDVSTPSAPPSSIRDDVIPASYNDKVVAFLKQPNIVEIIKERYPNITTSQPLNYKLNKIKQEGLAALERFTNSLQLNIMLSLFEEEIISFVVKDQSVLAERPSINRGNDDQQSSTTAAGVMTSSSSNLVTSAPTSGLRSGVSPSPRSRPILRNFNSKLRTFYRKLEQKGYGQGPGKLKLVVNRDNLLEDAYRKIINIERKQLQRCKFFVSFNGEEGLDYSGPSREFFFLISRELFNPYYGLFEYSAVDTYTVQISPLSAAFVDSPLQWFQFAGRIIGLALIHHCLLDAFFARPLYKMLLRSKCSLSDLRYVDEEFYQSMTWMQDNDITDVLDLDYTVDEEKFGKTETVELKPNGKNIAVTERNKKEYIDKMVKWRVERGIKEQTNMLIRGFNEVIDLRLVSVFDAKELELVICGTADIDLSDWRNNTEYRGGYHDNHQVIVNFWSALQHFDNERRLRLLQFVTGTSSVPYEGFSALRGPNGPKKFCIEKWGSPASLPRAHTCFNRIDLPPYTSFELLWEKLVIAVEETSTFAME